MNRLLELKNIRKKYGKKKVLQDISLHIHEKQMIAILGGNGSGKSTFLRIAAGVERSDAGQIVYADKNIRIGYVPERFSQYLRFTPDEYLYYIGKISGMVDTEIKQRIAALMYRFQLDAWRDRRINVLSKGNIQKVGIMQAILCQPDVLILDEPLSGLDFSTQQELVSILIELKEQGTTTLLTYHESAIFDKVVDQTYYIKDGHLTEAQFLEKEITKRIEVKGLNVTEVQEWNEILDIAEKEDRLLLYVRSKNSNQILTKILALQGNVEYVGNIDLKKNERQ